MKSRLLNFALATISALVVLTACQKDVVTSAPGLSIESEASVATFADDVVIVKATISDEVGIKSVTASCEAWELNKVFDLSTEKPKVYTLTYQFTVPSTVGRDFNEKLIIDVENVGNLHTQIEIPLTYLPDTAAPQLTDYKSVISVVFNTDGDSPMNKSFVLTDDRALKSVTFTIDELSFTDTKSINGKEYIYTPATVFTNAGTFESEITIVDSSDNETVLPISIVVMPEEQEDPIEDWDRMNIVNIDEDASKYIVGYYQPMSHDAAYTYSCTFYAPEADTHIAFVPQLNLTENWIGVSPYVSTKLINKNGYAEPITIAAAGYHTVSINIETKTYSITPYTPAMPDANTGLAGTLCMTGTGNSYGEWKISPHMTFDASNELSLYGDYDVTAYPEGAVSVCFSTSDWASVYRPDESSPNLVKGWYLSPDGKMMEFTSVGKGIYYVTLDAGISPAWVTIKASDDLDITPPDPDAVAKVSLSGDYNNWVTNDYLGYSKGLDKYFGYFNISSNLWGLNIIVDDTTWYKDSGDGETLATEGSNIAYDGAATTQVTGEYTFTVELNTLKYTMSELTTPAKAVALSGNFNSWATTTEMYYDTASGQYFLPYTFESADTVCFVVDGSDWYASVGSGALVSGTANIAVEAGTYLFTVDLTAMTFTATLQK